MRNYWYSIFLTLSIVAMALMDTYSNQIGAVSANTKALLEASPEASGEPVDLRAGGRDLSQAMEPGAAGAYPGQMGEAGAAGLYTGQTGEAGAAGLYTGQMGEAGAAGLYPGQTGEAGLYPGQAQEAEATPAQAKRGEKGGGGITAGSAGETGGEGGSRGQAADSGEVQRELPQGPDGLKSILSPDFSGTLFIGDSRTVGLSEYGELEQGEVFADSGMSVYNLFSKEATLRSGGKKTLEQVLSEREFRNIFLMLGINELGYKYPATLARYESVVERIQQLQPEAVLVLGANLHVTQDKSAGSPVVTNENIDMINQGIAEIAERKGCYYIDVNELFDDENGSLAQEYSTDGAHILGKYYKVWAEWIRNGGTSPDPGSSTGEES